MVLYRSGQLERAEEELTAVTAAQEKRLGASHMDTIRSRVRLAACHYDRQDYESARLLLEFELEACRTKMGNTHPNCLVLRHNLANTRRRLGTADEAECLQELRDVLCEQEALLGEDHHHSVWTRKSLDRPIQELQLDRVLSH
jgi:hypothetical protein